MKRGREGKERKEEGMGKDRRKDFISYVTWRRVTQYSEMLIATVKYSLS